MGRHLETGKDFRYVHVAGLTGDYAGASYTFEQGRMTITAADGSKLDIDAGNGDRATYRLTVESGGRKTSVVKPIEPLMKAFRPAYLCN